MAAPGFFRGSIMTSSAVTLDCRDDLRRCRDEDRQTTPATWSGQLRNSSKASGEFSEPCGDFSGGKETSLKGHFSSRSDRRSSTPLGSPIDYGGVTAFLRSRAPAGTAEVVAAETGLPEARVQKWIDGANGMHADSFAVLFATYGLAFLRAACPWLPDLSAALDAERRQIELEVRRAEIEREMRRLRPW